MPAMRLCVYAKQHGLSMQKAVEEFVAWRLPDSVGRPLHPPLTWKDWAKENEVPIASAKRIWESGRLDYLGVVLEYHRPWWEDPVEWKHMVEHCKIIQASIDRKIIEVEKTYVEVRKFYMGIAQVRRSLRFWRKRYIQTMADLNRLKVFVRDLTEKRREELFTYKGQERMRLEARAQRRYRGNLKLRRQWGKAAETAAMEELYESKPVRSDNGHNA